MDEDEMPDEICDDDDVVVVVVVGVVVLPSALASTSLGSDRIFLGLSFSPPPSISMNLGVSLLIVAFVLCSYVILNFLVRRGSTLESKSLFEGDNYIVQGYLPRRNIPRNCIPHCALGSANDRPLALQSN
jgi:hypothetical protein